MKRCQYTETYHSYPLAAANQPRGIDYLRIGHGMAVLKVNSATHDTNWRYVHAPGKDMGKAEMKHLAEHKPDVRKRQFVV